MSGLGIGHLQKLSNESKVGKQIFTYEQALRNSVRKERDRMKDVQWSDGDANALREIFETSITLCKGRDYTILQSFYTPSKQLKRVKINLPTTRISNELNDFGMKIHEECSDNVDYPLLAFINNSSPCHSKIHLDHKSWILLSINK